MSKLDLKPKTEHPLDGPRKMLQRPDASIAELEAALAAAAIVSKTDDAVLEEKRAERSSAVLGDGSADELDVKLEALDKDIAALQRRRDIAAATEAALVERVTIARAAEAERGKRDAYDKAVAVMEAYAPKQAEFLERSTREVRALLREQCHVALAIEAANRNLPDGASPIPGLESLRRRAPSKPEIQVREFRMWVDSNGYQFAEEGAGSATRRPDGKFDVSIPTNSNALNMPRSESRTCHLVDLVEITTTRRHPFFYGGHLAAEISIPAAHDGDPPGWAPSDAYSHPRAILQRLDQLEATEPGSGMTVETSTKRMTAEQWAKQQAGKAG